MGPRQLWDSARGQTLLGVLAPPPCLCGPLPQEVCESCGQARPGQVLPRAKPSGRTPVLDPGPIVPLWASVTALMG